MKNSGHRCKLVFKIQLLEIWQYCKLTSRIVTITDPNPFSTTNSNKKTTIMCICQRLWELAWKNLYKNLTERHGTSDVASEGNRFNQYRIWTTHGWRNSESIDTETFNFKHFVRFLHDFSQPQRFFQLAFPLLSRRGGFSIEDERPTIPSVVVHAARVHATGICAFRTRNNTYCIWWSVITSECPKETTVSLNYRICKVYKRQEIEG